ncbi:hypothetical protein EBB07_25905 [Paenibacillaceae bacterium]|nr:hypothetical protein EBB07_25905 [Paenibacillaceae bacterium]
MIQTAKKKSKRINNILFENKDILDATFDPETFDGARREMDDYLDKWCIRSW